ncbi:MAG TPA: hypothetical protein VEG38_18625 [Acidimicrobiia bacterium]|nr:hypothetical protein [Acidimicrobiia bacterium]
MGELGKPRRIRRAAGVAAALTLSTSLAAQATGGGLLAPILAPVTGGPGGAVALFQAPGGGYAAFATGTVLHAGVGGAAGAKLDVVSSTAAATAAANGSAINSELGRVVLPALPAKGSYGQGMGLGASVGLIPGLSTNLFGHAVATAPPSSAPVEQEALSIKVSPLAAASPLRGRAQALSSAGGCVLGSNLAYGQGNAADISLVGLPALRGLSLGNTAVGQPVSRSESRTVVVPGSSAGRLGLMSETTQVLGPVTLLAGTADQTVIEIKGQWALRVSADGKNGSVSYAPQGVANDEAAVLVRNAVGDVVASATASQVRLAGNVGVRLDIPGVGEIVVGEKPRARGKAAAAQVSGTSVDAAVDLVRIRLLGQDIRLGHMEAAVAVPPAGVTCPDLELTIMPDAGDAVVPGDTINATVKVRNPNEGSAADVAVNTRFAADPGIDARPGAVSFSNQHFSFGLEGLKLTTPLGPGQSVAIPMAVRVVSASAPGRIRLGASATGRYGDGPLAVPTDADLVVEGPPVKVPAAPAPGAGEPKVSVGGKGTATAGAPTDSGGRKPARISAGVTGAAGSAASAAPVAPTPNPAPVVTPPAIDTAPPASEPVPAPAAESGTVPSSSTTKPEETAVGRLPGENVADRRHYGWAAAAAIVLMLVAAAAASRLLGARR